MKKIKLFLTFVFVLFLTTTNVKAEELKQGTALSFSQQPINQTGLSINNYGYYYTNKYFMQFDGKQHLAYCMDPNATPTVTPVVREILGGETRNDTSKIFDAGILAILQEGYHLNNTSKTITNSNGTFSTSGDAFYVATSLAIRTYTIGFWNYGKDNNSTSSGRAYASANANLAILWDQWISAQAKAALKNYDNVASLPQRAWFYEKYKFTYADSLGTNTIYMAQDLFYKGIEAAAAYAKGETKEAKISSNVVDSNINVSGNTKTITRTIVLKPKNFGENGVLRSAEITFSANRDITVSGLTYYVNGNKTNNLNDISLKDNPKIEIVFDAKTRADDCEALNYKIKLAYEADFNDSNAVTGAIVDSSLALTSATQRFVFMVPLGDGDGKNLTKEINGKLDLCQNNCETTITVPQKCTDLKSGANEEWVESSILGPSNVVKCVVGDNQTGSWSNKYDDAGNTYKANACQNTEKEDNGMSKVASNSYCAVYCKEDYASIKFSGIQSINSGRYFKVGAMIDGKKSCYTSRIDTEQYIEDIIKVQTEMIETYDTYLNYVAAIQDFEEYTLGCGCCGGSRTAYKTLGSYTGITRNTPNYTTGGVTYKTEKKSHFSYSSTGSTCYMVSCGEKCSTCAGSCSDGEKFDRTILIPRRDAAAKKLKELKKQYEKMIASYQSCSSLKSDGWDTIFDFNQTIAYDYEEDYIEMKSLTYKDKELEIIDEKDEVKENWICNGDLASNDKGEYNSCSTSMGYKTASRTYIVCDTSGCDRDTYNISTARYVKKTSEKSATYDTPRVFYTAFPSGNIVTKRDANNSKLQTEVVDGLPVSLKTEVGAHKFKFNISYLGEFYDSCKTGRLIGADNSVVNQKNDSNKYKFIGEYVCYYKVNCPECEFVCENDQGGECTWDIPDKSTCVNCIFTVDRLQLYFRTISTNNFNPNKRALGHNWNYDIKVNDINYGFIAGKAGEAVNGTNGIITKGEEVYSNEPILTVNLTPDLANKIRDYNKTAEKSGGYGNDSITCYDYVEKGTIYKNLFCYSDFLDDFGDKYKENFKFVDTRILTKEARENNSNQKGYWNVYIDNMPIITESTIGGPSWK